MLRHVTFRVAVVAFGLAALVFAGLASTGDDTATAYQGKAPWGQVTAGH